MTAPQPEKEGAVKVIKGHKIIIRYTPKLKKKQVISGHKTASGKIRCKKCNADIEETFTQIICQGCGLEEGECNCEREN